MTKQEQMEKLTKLEQMDVGRIVLEAKVEVLFNYGYNEEEAADILEIDPGTVTSIATRNGLKCREKMGAMAWLVVEQMYHETYIALRLSRYFTEDQLRKIMEGSFSATSRAAVTDKLLYYAAKHETSMVDSCMNINDIWRAK